MTITPFLSLTMAHRLNTVRSSFRKRMESRTLSETVEQHHQHTNPKSSDSVFNKKQNLWCYENIKQLHLAPPPGRKTLTAVYMVPSRRTKSLVFLSYLHKELRCHFNRTTPFWRWAALSMGTTVWFLMPLMMSNPKRKWTDWTRERERPTMWGQWHGTASSSLG